MKLFIKNKLTSFAGSSAVLDESGRDVYVVKGAWPSLTKKKKIYSTDGELLYTVRNKFWHFIKKGAFVFDRRGGKNEKVAYIKSRFFGGFDILNNKEALELKAEPLNGIHVLKNGQEIAWYGRDSDLVSVFVRDAFTLDIKDPAYAPLLVAFVIAYDNIRDSYNNKKSMT